MDQKVVEGKSLFSMNKGHVFATNFKISGVNFYFSKSEEILCKKCKNQEFFMLLIQLTMTVHKYILTHNISNQEYCAF